MAVLAFGGDRITLRGYQVEAIDRILVARDRGVSRQLGVAACGLGKTIIFANLAERLNVPTLILAHRDELITQAAAKVRMVWPDVDLGIVKAERNETWADVVVASVQTLASERRLRQLPMNRYGLVICDEAHHSRASSYVRVFDRMGCGPENRDPNVLLLGVTATPDRGDGRGLDKLFDEVVWSYDILWGIRSGYLADLRGVAVKMDVNLDGVRSTGGDYNEGELGERLEAADAPTHVAAAWQAHAVGRPTIVFTPTVGLARETAAEFVARGIPAATVTGADDINERRRVLAAFTAGRIKVLTNCGVLTEGTDLPNVSCIVIARPTKSRALYTQMVGRSTRRHPDKTDALILDVVGATEQHDLVTIPSLFGVDKKAFERGERTVTEVVGEKEEAEIKAGRLIAAEVDLFNRLKQATKINWVQASGAYAIGLADRQQLVLSPGSEADLWTAQVLHPVDPTRVLMADASLEMVQGIAEDYIRRSGAGSPERRLALPPAVAQAARRGQEVACEDRPVNDVWGSERGDRQADRRGEVAQHGQVEDRMTGWTGSVSTRAGCVDSAGSRAEPCRGPVCTARAAAAS